VKGVNILLFAGWLVLIAAGVLVNRVSPLRPERVDAVWIAARDLPANTRLSTQDLMKPDGLIDESDLPPLEELLGKYLWVNRQAGEKVESADLNARPKIPDSAVTFVYSLDQAQAVLSDLLAPGDRVRVCPVDGAGGAGDCSGPLDVLATHAGATPEERWLLLDVAGQEAALREILDAPQHFILRIGKTSPGKSEPGGGD
jgi:hypothetical protein